MNPVHSFSNSLGPPHHSAETQAETFTEQTNDRISGAAIPRILAAHYFPNFSSLRINNPDTPESRTLPTEASAINQSDEQRLEAILQSWLDDPQAEGDKETAADRIREAHQKGSKFLSLSGLELTIIPPELFSFLSKVKSLLLEKNRLSSLLIPQSSLPNLTALDVSHNQILGLDFSEGALPKLKYLWVFDNQISNLRLSENTCPELQELDASRNQILSFSVGAYSQLRSVRLDNNPSLTDLPTALRNASNLRDISCENTQIPREQVNAIPEAARSLRGLQTEDGLSQQLNLWASYAKLSPEAKNNLFNSILKFSPEEQILIANRLFDIEFIRLSLRSGNNLSYPMLKFSPEEQVLIPTWLLELESIRDRYR